MTSFDRSSLIAPLFVTEGNGISQEIPSLPGQRRFSVDAMLEKISALAASGIRTVIPYGISSKKNPRGSEAFDSRGIAQRAVAAIKKEFPSVTVVADVCLCQFTDHGHCGVIEADHVHNDRSLEELSKAAVSLADSGADMLMISSMMDGAVRTTREALEKRGLGTIPLLSQSAKYCSAFYGPFRSALDSHPRLQDKAAYQVSPSNAREALREAAFDIREGIDILVVKPTYGYYDMLARFRALTNLPIWSFCTSGEYNLLRAHSEIVGASLADAAEEYYAGGRRAGADRFISYLAAL